MPQQITDFIQGCTMVEHPGGQAMAEDVGASIFRLHTCPFQRPIHQRTDGNRVGKAG
jgi:hypothetical protein